MEKLFTTNYGKSAVYLFDWTVNKTAIIFLHEALGSFGQWRNFPKNLSTELHLPFAIIERTGHGKSDALSAARTQSYLHDYEEETSEILKDLLLPEQKYILIGHSDGGTISLLHAAKKPKNLAGIITMAAHTFVEEETLSGIEPAINAFEAGKLDGLKKYHGEKTKDLFYDWANTWRADFFRHWDIRQEIKSINCPILALQGANDQYGTIEQLKSIANAHEEVDILEIENCGHHPHLEKEEITVKKIKKFINYLLKVR